MILAAPMAPVALSERIETMDVLRGMALFGIIASNMRAFGSPMAAYFDHSLMWQGTADRIAQIVIDVFITGKFITLFSFLFGLGFAIMMDRARERGWTSGAFYLRRLTALFVLGLCHAFFLWSGDILAPYAVMGFFLFSFRDASQRRILYWSVFLYVWPLLLNLVVTLLLVCGVPIDMPGPATPQELQRVIAVYSRGTYAQMFAERLQENTFMGFAIIYYYPRLLGLFLFGLWVWRRGLIRDLAARESLWKQCRRLGLSIGLPLNIAWVAISEIYRVDPFSGPWLYSSSRSIPSASPP